MLRGGLAGSWKVLPALAPLRLQGPPHPCASDSVCPVFTRPPRPFVWSTDRGRGLLYHSIVLSLPLGIKVLMEALQVKEKKKKNHAFPYQALFQVQASFRT